MLLIKLLNKIRQILKGLLKRNKNGESAIVVKTLPVEEAALFNARQREVINRGVALGFNMKDIMKPKYSAEQMVVLLYAKMLSVENTTFNSYALSPEEMRYNLYVKTAEKYLGKDYLSKLLLKNQGSLADSWIKQEIDKALEHVLKASQEVAVTTAFKELEPQKVSRLYDTIVHLCVDRKFYYKDISTADISMMKEQYVQKQREAIQALSAPPIDYKLLIDVYMFSKSVKEIKKLKTFREMITPIKMYKRKSLEYVTTYYLLIDDDNYYLYNNEKNFTIRL